MSCCRLYIDPSDASEPEVRAGQLCVIGSGINKHLFYILTHFYLRPSQVVVVLIIVVVALVAPLVVVVIPAVVLVVVAVRVSLRSTWEPS